MSSSDMKASVVETANGLEVKGVEYFKYGFTFVDDIFDPKKSVLAEQYKKWGRCLLVTDKIIYGIYGERMQAYFDAHDIPVTFKTFDGGEIHKTMDTMLSLVDAFNKFGLIRKEPVLAVGGGLVTDVCGVRLPSSLRFIVLTRLSVRLRIVQEDEQLYQDPYESYWLDRRCCLDQGWHQPLHPRSQAQESVRTFFVFQENYR